MVIARAFSSRAEFLSVAGDKQVPFVLMDIETGRLETVYAVLEDRLQFCRPVVDGSSRLLEVLFVDAPWKYVFLDGRPVGVGRTKNSRILEPGVGCCKHPIQMDATHADSVYLPAETDGEVRQKLHDLADELEFLNGRVSMLVGCMVAMRNAISGGLSDVEETIGAASQ